MNKNSNPFTLYRLFWIVMIPLLIGLTAYLVMGFTTWPQYEWSAEMSTFVRHIIVRGH